MIRYFELLHGINTFGDVVSPREKETKELIGKILTLDNYNAISTTSARTWMQISAYLFPELAWYMSGDRKPDKILPYSKFWKNILTPEGLVNSNYGDLVFYRKNSYGYSSFSWALAKLNEDPDTRKAIILYNDREFFYDENRDLICNQYQQFMIRDGKLICLVALRSSDAIFGLTYNMPWWSFVHQMLYLNLLITYPNLKLGKITAFLGSVHVYANKYDLVEQMLNDDFEYRFLMLKEIVPLGKTFEEYMEIIPNVFRE